jgi:hypothetical protein
MGKLPGGEFSEIFGASHAAESCNRMACRLSAKSGLIENERAAEIEEFAMFQND